MGFVDFEGKSSGNLFKLILCFKADPHVPAFEGEPDDQAGQRGPAASASTPAAASASGPGLGSEGATSVPGSHAGECQRTV